MRGSHAIGMTGAATFRPRASRVHEVERELDQRHLTRCVRQRDGEITRTTSEVEHAGRLSDGGRAHDVFHEVARERSMQKVIASHPRVVSRNIIGRTEQHLSRSHVVDRLREPLTLGVAF
jgi:hypothetical protein